MAQIEIILPKMGESVAEATITSWLKQAGDTVEADEAVLEIATDKVDSEVPAPEDGTILEVKFAEGDVVQVGEVIAIMETDAVESGTTAAPSSAAVEPKNTPETPSVTQVAERVEQAVIQATPIASNGSNGRFYSPLVRSIASKEGMSLAELDAINGTGQAGRVTKKDILAYLPHRNQAKPVDTAPLAPVKAAVTAPSPAPKEKVVKAPAVSLGADDEIIEMDRMRKLIADHMVMSKQVSPHVTSYVEADVTNLVMWRNKIKKSFQEREGEKLTFTPIFIEAITKAIKDFPMINVSVDGDKIIRRKHINVGMATALPTGNLIVPVIKDTDMLNLTGLAHKVNDLANRARNNALSPDEIQGGTYTVTNVGTFGNVMGTPIINQPQCAIMALGAIRKKPAVIETPQGDFIGIRHMMFLSHAYDHRVIDGALGGSFVRRVADYLEGFDPEREL